MRCVVRSPAGYYQHANRPADVGGDARRAKVFATLPRADGGPILARNRVRAEVVWVDTERAAGAGPAGRLDRDGETVRRWRPARRAYNPGHA